MKGSGARVVVIFVCACGGSGSGPDGSMIDAAVDASPDADCSVENACDENSPGPDPETCGECGATGQSWGVPMYASRGVCAYANGPGTGLHGCTGDSITSDQQVPLVCISGDSRTVLQGSSLRSSHAFQCVEYARRYTTFTQSSYNASSIGGNACEWWNAQVPGLQRFENGTASATSPPAEGDLLIFWNRSGGSWVCSDAKVGHIAVVTHHDSASGRITISEENYDTKPRQLAVPRPTGANPWRITDTSTTLMVRGWIRLPTAAPSSCGVRSLLHTHASLPHPPNEVSYEQLVTCGPGYYCNVNAGQCRPVVADGNACANNLAVCTGGTRCDGTRCVCDDTADSGATYFRFDDSTRCWRPGPFVANADGCSSTIGIAQDPGGADALLIRDMHTQDPMVISPRVSLVAAANHELVVSAACTGLPGGATTGRMRIYLSRVLGTPEFDPAFGGFALAAQDYVCDGTARELHFPMTVSEGTIIGRIRIDPLDGGAGGYEGASVWVRSVEYRQVNSPVCTDGDGDGYGVGAGCLGPDCNDAEPAAWTGRTEVLGDNIDNQCNGMVDEYVVTNQATFQTAMAVSTGAMPVARRVILQAGAYTLGGDERLGRNVWYEGAGSGSVTINLQAHCFEVNHAGTSMSGVTLTNGGGCFQHSRGGALGVAATGALSLTDVIVTSSTTQYGGAIAVDEGGSLTASRLRLTGNSANPGQGGALFSNGGTVSITGAVIANNTAQGGGGGISIFGNGANTTLRNVVVANNVVPTSNHGGGIFTEGALQLLNVSLIDNVAQLGFGGDFTAWSTAQVTATSLLVYSNSGGNFFVGNSAQLTISYSLVAPSDHWGSLIDAGNNLFDLPPQFVQYSDNSIYDDNFGLSVSSPGRNAGSPALGNDVDGSANDMGAYGGPSSGQVP